MQEVSGAYLTDFNGIARLFSIDLAVNQGLHSFLRKKFAPQIQMIAHPVERRRGIPAFCLRAPLAGGCGLRTIACQTGSRWISVFENMMFDCLRVCHLWFQNEVIGG